MRPVFLSILALILALPHPVRAGEDAPTSCPKTLDINIHERDALAGFSSRLRRLDRYYGSPQFDAEIERIVKTSWPKTKLIQVSPTFVERAVNRVDQEQLRNSIAKVINLTNPAWTEFESDLRDVTFFGGYVVFRWDRFPKKVEKLIGAIKKSVPPKGMSREEYEFVKAEAILRVADMTTYLIRWSQINRGIIDEKGREAEIQLAIMAVGAVGGGVMLTTMAASGAIVGGAGTYASSLSANPVVSRLLMKVGETAGGVALGVVGAPAALAITDAHFAYSEAKKNSDNLQTSFACELGKQMQDWKERGASPYLEAAFYGGALGAAGGALTFTRASSKVVLYATGFGVGVAQAYSLGKMSTTAMESLAYYKLAMEADAAGEHEKALKLLFKSRDLAQESQQKGLESIIIGTLSVYVVGNFKNAMVNGERAIRTLYANSADTLPLASKAVISAIPKTNVVPLSEEDER